MDAGTVCRGTQRIATIGLASGMANGIFVTFKCWTKIINDTLMTTIAWVGTVKVSDRVKMTLEHINKQIPLDKLLRLW